MVGMGLTQAATSCETKFWVDWVEELSAVARNLLACLKMIMYVYCNNRMNFDLLRNKEEKAVFIKDLHLSKK